MKILKKILLIFFDMIDEFIHQKKIIKEIKLYAKNINCFIDVGSHKGNYTDIMLKNFKIKKILMFEPQKNIFEFIKKKYAKKNKVKIMNVAVSSSRGNQKFYINRHDLTSSLNLLNKNNLYLKIKSKLFNSDINSMIKKFYLVKTVKLNEVIKNYLKRSYKMNVLKIDTEGHEYEVLKGLDKEIKFINIILIEIHKDDVYLNYNYKKIHSHIIKNNFSLKKIIKFPFTTWEDRIYINKNTLKKNYY